jgi:hypothetical protein
MRVGLDRHNLGASFDERKRERPKPCANLDNPVAGTHLSEASDASNRVRI